MSSGAVPIGSHRIAAVVLSWREVDDTIDCVKSLIASRDVHLIVVVENEAFGALGTALEGLDDRRIVFLPQTANLGFSAGVNVGVRYALATVAPSDLILVINNDSTLDARSLREMSSKFGVGSDMLMVAPHIEVADGSIESPALKLRRWAMSVEECERNPDFLTWACVMTSAAALKQVGLLDERFFMYWEDVEFGIRARALGMRLETVPSARLSHRKGGSHVSAGPAIETYAAHGLVVLSRICPGWGVRFGTAVRVLLRLSKRAARLDRPRFLAVLDGALTALRNRDARAAELFPRKA